MAVGGSVERLGCNFISGVEHAVTGLVSDTAVFVERLKDTRSYVEHRVINLQKLFRVICVRSNASVSSSGSSSVIDYGNHANRRAFSFCLFSPDRRSSVEPKGPPLFG